MRKFFWASLVALAAAGCDGCDTGEPPQETYGKIEVDKTSLGYPATCPTPAKPEFKVEFTTKSITLRNAGLATSTLTKFEMDAAGKDVFVWDAAKVPTTIAAGDSVEIPITFKPPSTAKAGSVSATLTIQGDRPAPEVDKTEITLLGEVKGFDPVPIFSMTCAGDTRFSTDGCAVSPPHMDFDDTGKDGTAEITVTLRNGGCPTLTVTDVVVTTKTGAEGTFALAEGQATNITVLGGNAEPGTIKVRFTPKEVSDELLGELTFKTNDPDHQTVTTKISGAGTAPSLVVETSLGCGAPDPSQNVQCCDFRAGKFPCTGNFTLRNQGTKALTISKVSLKNGNAMFKLGDTSAAVGKEIPAMSKLTNVISVEYVPGLIKESDFLVVDSDGGAAQAELKGGSPPFLVTDPPDAVDFGLALDHSDHFKALTVTNKATYNKQLDLTVKDLVVTDTRQAFNVVTAAEARCPTGSKPFVKDTVIKADESFVACVHFLSDDNGGAFSAPMSVLSNDPNYPEGLMLELRAQATCDTKPTAIIEVRALSGGSCPCEQACPATSGCQIEIDPKTSLGQVVLNGESSFAETYDFDPEGKCVKKGTAPVQQYVWTLDASNDSAAVLTPNGATATLTIGMTVPHLVRLEVVNAQGIKSNKAVYSVTGTTE